MVETPGGAAREPLDVGGTGNVVVHPGCKRRCAAACGSVEWVAGV